MDLLNAILLGIIQGLTEFLPISSSAHLQIAEAIWPLSAQLSKAQLTAFIATIQLGTEAAVLIYFFKDIVRIVKAWFKSIFNRKQGISQDAKMGWLIIIGSIPVVVIGLAFKDFIETDLRNLWVIALTLIGFGLLLGVSDRFGAKKQGIEKLSARDGVLFGIGQALAVIPGVSRSGGTITVGLMLGYTRAAAARYSFLLAIPAVLASGLYEFGKTYQDLDNSSYLATAAATIVAFIVGWLVITSLLKYLNKGSFLPFVIWRVLLGVGLIIALSNGLLTA
ncbi:MAG: undecaprenyl-diphosphate phosphatase [Micrococcales bacterium]